MNFFHKITFTLFLLLNFNTLFSKNIKGTLAFIPGLTEKNNTGIFPNLLKELNRFITEDKITANVLPYSRSVKLVVEGKSMFHYPFAYISDSPPPKGTIYSSFSIHSVEFGLFYNSNTINDSNINLNNYKIGSTIAHKMLYFPEFKKIKAQNCAICLFDQIKIGRVDGIIFEIMSGKNIIKMKNIKNIKLSKLKKYPVKFLFPDSIEGRKLDIIIKKAYMNSSKNGGIKPVLNKLIKSYESIEIKK